jgi:cAMP-dependent protein kinase regulator
LANYDEPSSDDDDNEDEEVDFDLPSKNALLNKKQRISEAYGKFNKKSDFVPRVIPKTEDQKKRITDRLSKAFMFSSLEDREKEITVDAMEERRVSKGEWVIKQGDDGDNLYVVDQGTLECYKRFSKNEEPKLVKTYNPGESFGELALLYNAPRAASIKAVTDCVLFALDRATFNNIVKDAEVKRRERFEQIISRVELLETMDPYERSKIADVAVPVKFKAGDYVIRQGEEGDKFYFIEDGNAVATKILTGKTEPEVVYQYKPGDYFGELALLKGEPRAANVIAKSDLTLLALDRVAFNRVLGPLNDILKRNTKKYEKFM